MFVIVSEIKLFHDKWFRTREYGKYTSDVMIYVTVINK